MMNKLFIPALLLFFAVSFGCKKEPESTGIDLTLHFKTTYNGNQLKRNTDYPFGAFPIRVDRFRMYLSDITLLKGDQEVKIADAAYLDFTPDNTGSDLTATPSITLHNVPEDMYDGIRIGFGVNPVNNAKRPSDFPSSSPLSEETDYWLGWKSYIFLVFDGRADTDNDGVKDLPFSYHCGSDPVYTVDTFPQHIHVAQDHPGLDIEFDVLRFMTNDDGSLYDIQTNPNTSNSANDTRVAKELMSHLQKATTITQ